MNKKKVKRRYKIPPNIFEEGGGVLKQGWGQQSSSKVSEAFNQDNLGSSLENIGGALEGIAGAGIKNSQIADTSDIEAMNAAQNNMVVRAATNDDLMSEWGSRSVVKDDYSWKDVRGGSSGQRASNTLGAVGQGVATGASVGGPFGAVIGGVIGLGTAIGGWITGNRKAKKRAKRLNQAASEANNRSLGAFELRADNLDTQNDFNMLANYAAYGGPLDFGRGAIGYELANKQLNNQEMDILTKQKLSSLPNSFQTIPELNTYNSFKDGGGIHIKKKNRGKFTEYCGGKVTSACIAKGKRSSNPTTRKRATFAANARKWHEEGGPLVNRVPWAYTPSDPMEGTILGGNPLPAYSENQYSGIIPYSPDFNYSNLVKELPEDKAFEFIKYLENNENKGIRDGIAHIYDKENRTAGYGTDIISGHPELAEKVRSGKFTEKEARQQAIRDMKKSDRAIMKVIGEKYTTRPDTISLGPRLMAAQAKYHYGNIVKDMPELGPAIANGDADEIKRIILRKAKGHGKRWDKLNEYDIYKDTYACGGNLFQHGGDFTNGVTFINEGGLHEENPYEGVQMGVDPQGIPNLVEEGEIVYNDYVFSNRMKIPKDIKKEYKLKGKTFAKAAESVQRESEERPNDPISSRGLESAMERVAQAQEETRQRKEVNREDTLDPRVFDYGGDLFDTDQIPQIVSRVPYAPIYSLQRPFLDPKELREHLQVENKYISPKSAGKRQTWSRYAPIIGSGVATISDLFSNPDYSGANMISDVDLSPSTVGFSPIGNYLSYNPLDRNFYINKLNQQASATRRGLMDTSGGNRLTAQAGILAADYNYGQNLGNLARQAEEYNQQQRERVEAFNRSTNMFNTETGLKAATFNADSVNASKRAKLSQAQTAAQMRQAIKDQETTRRSANLTNFLQGLGDMGWENEQANWLDELAKAGVLKMNTRGEYTGRANKAQGGKVKTKRKKGLTYG